MTEYLFVLGRSWELCQEELQAVLAAKQLVYKPIFSSENILHLELSQTLDCEVLMRTLGGTIKIAQVFEALPKKNDLTNSIATKLTSDTQRIIFGLSWYGKISGKELRQLVEATKEKLQEKGYSVRYILPKEGEQILSSVVVEKQKVNEIIVSEENGKLVLAKTCVVQEFDQWNKRDYQRPMVLPEKGMLPPKVARMMVNIGCGKLEIRSEKRKMGNENLTLLDPFCGMGTILQEALLLDINVIGSDIDVGAINSSKKNLEWLCKTYNLPKGYKLFVNEATHLSEKLRKESVDIVVTEPYLGPLIEANQEQLITKDKKILSPGYLRRIIDGLERLYIGCLKDWQKILTKNGVVVIILPSFKLNNKEFFVKKVVDNCENLGYSIEVGPLPYSRPQAVVKRNIYILKKNTN